MHNGWGVNISYINCQSYCPSRLMSINLYTAMYALNASIVASTIEWFEEREREKKQKNINQYILRLKIRSRIKWRRTDREDANVKEMERKSIKNDMLHVETVCRLWCWKRDEKDRPRWELRTEIEYIHIYVLCMWKCSIVIKQNRCNKCKMHLSFAYGWNVTRNALIRNVF